MKATVTSQHLEAAILAISTGERRSSNCLMAQVCHDAYGARFNSCAQTIIVLSDNTELKTGMDFDTLVSDFDASYVTEDYSAIRARLPLEIDLPELPAAK